METASKKQKQNKSSDPKCLLFPKKPSLKKKGGGLPFLFNSGKRHLFFHCYETFWMLNLLHQISNSDPLSCATNKNAAKVTPKTSRGSRGEKGRMLNTAGVSTVKVAMPSMFCV